MEISFFPSILNFYPSRQYSGVPASWVIRNNPEPRAHFCENSLAQFGDEWDLLHIFPMKLLKIQQFHHNGDTIKREDVEKKWSHLQ